ncbi:hypothetical protein MIR68_008824 [Amoeboaphelidium protococcarum]|nr:hypothetical protein MIR68_008824 [Amoeboaphelidium protococcarum]
MTSNINDNGGTQQSKKLLMIPGPIEFHENVLAAMATYGTSHVAPNFIDMFGESLEMLRQVVFTKTGQPFILSGSGTLGWDSAVCNLMEAGDEALVINTGYFGDSFGDCLESYGFKATHVRAPQIGDVPSIKSICEALAGKNYKLVNITHVDTSTGVVVSNIKEIVKAVRDTCPDAVVCVDAVCSLAGERFYMDEWDVDFVMTGSQKALGVPAGLCIFVASQSAIQVFQNRKTHVQNYYCSWKNWIPIMQSYEGRKPSYFATPAVNLIMALNVSLKQILAQGMEKRFASHEAASAKIKDTLTGELGLKLVPVNRQVAANTLTAVYYPQGVKAGDLLPKIGQNGVVLAGGLHKDIAPQYFRIGHMGISVTETARKHVETTLEAIKQALFQCIQK